MIISQIIFNGSDLVESLLRKTRVNRSDRITVVCQVENLTLVQFTEHCLVQEESKMRNDNWDW